MTLGENMVPMARRSLNELLALFGVLAVCATAPVVSAQHSIGPASGGIHIYTPPMPHVPISPAPLMRSPIILPPMAHAPFSGPRTLATSAGTLGMTVFRPPRRPTRPLPPILIVYESPFFFGGPLLGLDSCWWTNCDFFWTVDYTTVSSPGPTNYVEQVYEVPVYGEESPDTPELFLKDGTVLNVTDYWIFDGQLHFTIIEEEGAKPTEHMIPFETLDLQRTVDVNARRGFHFMLRNEPVEQYMRDHPELAR